MSVVYFLLMVGVLVTVHELGHFVAAKVVGVKVVRFSLGFGPAIARIAGRETEYQIGAIPLGGYVRLFGEDPRDTLAGDTEEAHDDRARAFSEKPLLARLAVVFAGPFANLLSALLIYFSFFARQHELPAPVIGDVLAGGAAAAAGIRPGDRVLEINGERVRYWEDLEERIDASAGKMLRFKLGRDGGELYAYVTPRVNVLRGRAGERSEQGLIGVTQAPFAPLIGVVDAASPAARAGLRTGDRIVAIDGRRIDSYGQLEAQLARLRPRAQIAYLRPRRAAIGFADVTVADAGVADLLVEARRGRRDPGIAPAELFVSAVDPGSPAARAGLLPGDVISALDGAPVSHWVLFDQALLAAAERPVTIGWRRARPGGGVDGFAATLRQERRTTIDEYGQRHDSLVFGARNDFPIGTGATVPIEGRFARAAGHALERTGETVALMATGFVALLRGKLPGDSVGGPIMVFRMASVSGAQGWEPFLMMLALISINLGLINLLPIPILDGGHLLVFAVEGLRRRRLSPRVREGVVMAGLLVIVSLTVLALRNDIVRYLLR